MKKIYYPDNTQASDRSSSNSSTTTYAGIYQAEKGWECPRCGSINAPWVRQCNCTRNTWTITCGDTSTEDWRKQITCDSDTFKIHPESITFTANSMKDPDLQDFVGGSDFWDADTNTWVNVRSSSSNIKDNPPRWVSSQQDN